MKNKVMGRAALGFGLAWVLAVGATSFTLQGCANDPAAEDKAKVGVIDLALTGTSASGVIYRLRDAQIQILGASSQSLSTEDYLDQTQISLELVAGGYLADLQPDWRLERSLDGGMTFEDVRAILISTDPLPFTVFDQQTTDVRLVFRAGDDVVELGNGRAIISIDVIDEFSPPPPPSECGQICQDAEIFVGCPVPDACVPLCEIQPDDVPECAPFIQDYQACAQGLPGDLYTCSAEGFPVAGAGCEFVAQEMINCLGSAPPPMCDVDADGDGWCQNQGDCDDSDPQVHPGAPDMCNDGIDQNCNGIDDNCIPQQCFDACSVAESLNCIQPPEFCPEICGNLTGILGPNPPAECIAIAQNYMACAQNMPGEAYICSVDGFAIAGPCETDFQNLLACLNPPPPPCDSDSDMDGWCANQGDCNDGDPNVNPGVVDVCQDGIDQNCDNIDPPCVSPNWTCDPTFFGTNDGCDCGCGEPDPDCNGNPTVGVCDFCDDPGSCSMDSCPGNIDPNNNATCF